MECGPFVLLWRIQLLRELMFELLHVLVLTLHLDIIVYNLRGNMFGIYNSVSILCTMIRRLPILQIDTGAIIKLQRCIFKDSNISSYYSFGSVLLPTSYTM